MKRVGVYYEGVVESAEEVLEKHNRLTITTNGPGHLKSASVKRREKTVVSPIVLFKETKMSMFFLQFQKQIQPPKLF